MTCCGCFHRQKRGSIAFSDIYYRPCVAHGKCALRSPLGPPENKCNCNGSDRQKVNKLLVESEYELGKETVKNKPKKKAKEVREKTNYTEFEFADDAISLNNESFDDSRPPSSSSAGSNKSQKETIFTENPYITVNGREELPCVDEIKNYSCFARNLKTEGSKTNCINRKEQLTNDNIHSRHRFDGNYNKLAIRNIYSYCTLPKRRNGNNHKGLLHWITPPKRITPDGTHIYYWCDLQKKCANGKLTFLPDCTVLKY